ncbi:MAG: PASTA domain-containing protein [Bifidobacterium sp.]|jgi:serine/threonine-protein kinase|nr:PASTA domain-containing protein [Bifidobacterium sp.]
MTEAAQAPQGQMIEGRYRIVRKIADGGMATVYQALDERLERTVAIKIMHIQLARGPHRDQFVQRFRREARLAAAIANDHIVQVYDTGEYEGLDYLVMEYVHGVNLRHDMDAQSTFSVRETLRIIAETLEGLAAAHRADVVHRDIKPENILLNDRGHVQITDFGLAKAASQATLSSTGMLLGTAAYLAPEMIERNQATAQGDLYAVGIVAWEMLAGEVPFISANPVTLVFKHVHEDVPSITDLCPGVDERVANFIAHLVAREVEARPENAQKALDELRGVMAGLDAGAWQYRLDPAPVEEATHDDEAHVIDSQSRQDGKRTRIAGTNAQPGDTRHTPIGAAAIPVAPPTPPLQLSTSQERTQVLREKDRDTLTRMIPATRQADNRNGSRTQNATQSIATMPGQQPHDDAAVHKVSTPYSANAARGASRSGDSASDDLTSGNSSAEVRTPHSLVRAKRRPLIIAIIVALALALSGGGMGWWYLRGPGSYWTMPKPNDSSCAANAPCTIANVAWAPYESTLKIANIPYRVTKKYSDTVAKNRIIATEPAHVGDRVGKRDGSTVTLIISQGIKQATIPADILNPTSVNGKDPLAALERAGFTNVNHDESNDEYSLTLPKSAASAITPDPGTTMDHSKEIDITLSKGPMPVSMPDVVGRSRGDAQAAFDDAKLEPTYSEEFSDTVATGNIISVSVQPGTQLHWGDDVDVVVSKGPEMVTIPDVRGQNTDDARTILEALGLQVRVSAPLGDLTHTVRLQDPGPGQQVRVRSKTGAKTVITLTVV